jgi:ectoine hydroxylase-related dioxygenase (phytanoyl-CoA dioxygenase family)
VIVPGWICDREVAHQRKAMEAVPVLRTAPTGLTVRAHNLLGKTRACDHLAMDPRLLALVQGHLRDKLRFSICTLMDILPGEEAQALHQDDAMYKMPRPHMPLTVNAVITLDEFTADNGATRVVPGSWEWAGAVDQAIGSMAAVPARCPAGSLIAWSGATWHGGGANHSAHPRLALNFHYCRAWLKPQESQLLGVDPADILSMPQQMQELLGLTGSVGFRPPVQVLADRELGRSTPWVHPSAAPPGVSQCGGPLPPDTTGRRRIVGGRHDGCERVGQLQVPKL